MMVSSYNERVTAIVPIRHHSQRVPGKNYRLCAGRPLYRYVIDCLLAATRVARVVVETDSATIRADCIAVYGDAVLLMERPESLRAPETSMNRILLSAVAQLGTGYYLQTHATNPLLRPATVDAAVARFFTGFAEGACDSLFSVTPRRVRLWDAEARPLNHDPERLLQTQDLPPFFEENSCLYLFSAASLQQCRRRIGARPLLYAMEPSEAVDIDEDSDFLLAEALLRLNLAVGAASEE